MLDYVISYVQKGGWVLLPIFLTSVLGWHIIFRNWMMLNRFTPKEKNWHRKIQYARGIIRWVSGDMHKNDLDSIPGRILKHMYALRKYSREDLLDVYQTEMLFNIPKMEKGMTTLAVYAGVAPLLGLLGTVSGMVNTFSVISVFGAGNPALMADSIGEALVTTQNGLLAAIPLMLGHILLLNKSVQLERNTEKAVHKLINYLNKSALEDL